MKKVIKYDDNTHKEIVALAGIHSDGDVNAYIAGLLDAHVEKYGILDIIKPKPKKREKDTGTTKPISASPPEGSKLNILGNFTERADASGVYSNGDCFRVTDGDGELHYYAIIEDAIEFQKNI